ncbi:MAG: hypothetical protein P1U32_03405 [Legionellaceae bacterium]|nr:hypothetical protein [Legionellaceae bacterium]
MRLKTAQYMGVMLAFWGVLVAGPAVSSTPSGSHDKDAAATITFLSVLPPSSDFKKGHTVIQLGGFWASMGKAQNINVRGLAGNRYTLNNKNQSNGLVGLGYFIDGSEQERFQLSYGVNLFYLGPIGVSGYIFQEQLYRNLTYFYKIQQMPLYAAAKAKIKTHQEKYNIALDAGVGPNFMRAGGYKETPLNAFTLPDNGFAARSKVTFSATAGVGVRINEMFGDVPLEIGYRFFYLGKGQLAINNNQLINPIKTGSMYANAIICSVTV